MFKCDTMIICEAPKALITLTSTGVRMDKYMLQTQKLSGQ